MSFDSTIRLKQLNQPELASFISGIISSYPAENISGNIVSSGSGIFNIGSLSNPYNNIYSESLNVTGINIGGVPFSAYTSGGEAYLNLGGIIISSSGDSIYISGPQGIQGPTGATGAIGPTGANVTGVSYNNSNYNLTFYLNNNTTISSYISPLSGATGISVSGFIQSGNLIYPVLTNYTIGSPVTLIAGPQGIPAAISMDFIQSGNTNDPLTNFPNQVIIDNYYNSNPAPSISLLRGMTYNFGFSGINSYILTSQDILLFEYTILSGQSLPFSAGSETNYYENTNNGTGYWRLAFFPSGTSTGFYSTVTNPSLFIETSNSSIYGNSLITDIFRSNITFNALFTAQCHYKYGFMVYTFNPESPIEDVIMTTNTGYAFVLGDIYFSSGIGPLGPQGPIGAGIQGPQGNVGPIGPSGAEGTSVTSYNQRQLGSLYQLQFIFSDGSTGPWVNLPAGGPRGTTGPIGPVGSLINYFAGPYSSTTGYTSNITISYSGSTYINTGTSSGISPPNSPWQLLAEAGSQGPSGASGIASTYNANFYIQSGFPTGHIYNQNILITGLTVNGIDVSGKNSYFTTGSIVSFYNSGLINLAYTPYQQVLVSTNSYTGTYFYGTINSYNEQNGLISLNVLTGLNNLTGIPGTTISGTSILWYNYNNATINLGANVVSGAVGPQGVQGIQGPGGTASILHCQNYTGSYNLEGGSDVILLEPTGFNLLGTSGIDIFNILITGNTYNYLGGAYSCILAIDYNYFQTGQCLLVKVRNSGISSSVEPNLFEFSGSGINVGQIYWPNGIYTQPNSGTAYIYSLLRLPDEFGTASVYGTYTNPF